MEVEVKVVVRVATKGSWRKVEVVLKEIMMPVLQWSMESEWIWEVMERVVEEEVVVWVVEVLINGIVAGSRRSLESSRKYSHAVSSSITISMLFWCSA